MSWPLLFKIGAQTAWNKVSGRKTLPLVTVFPSFRCNLRCRYCNFPQLAAEEMPLSKWLAIIDELASLGLRRVHFLGGEPLLYPALPDLLERCRSRGIVTAIGSNGQLAPECADWLHLADRVVLSMDAADPAVDTVRGHGVWEGLQAAVAVIKEQNIRLGLTAVISTATAGHLQGLVEYANRHGATLNVNLMRSGDLKLWRDNRRLQLERQALDELLERLETISRRERCMRYSPRTYRLARQWPDFSRDLMLKPLSAKDSKAIKGYPRCKAGQEFIGILPDGRATPCMSMLHHAPAANVLEHGVEGAWKRLWKHDCVACPWPCTLELNSRLNLHPAALWHALRVQGEG